MGGKKVNVELIEVPEHLSQGMKMFVSDLKERNIRSLFLFYIKADESAHDPLIDAQDNCMISSVNARALSEVAEAMTSWARANSPDTDPNGNPRLVEGLRGLGLAPMRGEDVN